VAVPTKQGILYMFDRVTGAPVWPFEERAVEKGDVPGEWYAPTQPIPTRPVAYARNGVTAGDLIDFTPALRDAGLATAAKFKLGPIFTPPVLSKADGPLATFSNGPTNGGSNWPGGSYDPETHLLYVSATNASPSPLGLVVPAAGTSDMNYVRGFAPGAGRGGFTVQGLPLLKPPYGTISAINLDKGEIVWQVAHGETPDAVRNHEALKGVNVPRTGQAGTVGTLVTKTLVIAGDPEVTNVAPRGRGAMLRAYDKASGKEVGGVLMPAPQSGSPMTYTLGGRQYIVVAVSGGAWSGEYIAYRLPIANPR
jgi:quinoprotein glucose dehydrogenase